MSDLLNEQKLNDFLANASDWKVVDHQGVNALTKTYQFDDFAQALFFVNQVGEKAEENNHHPEIHLSWGKVIVFWWSHDVGGISARDTALALAVDQR